MKKLLLLLLCLALLTGCTREETGKPTPPTTPVASAPGLYLPDSVLETQTNHAVRAYALDEPVVRLEPMGEELLVATMNSQGRIRLRLLSGEQGTVRCQRLLEAGVSFGGGVRIGPDGICYYNAGEHTVVVLDQDLEERERTSLPGQITADPVITQDFSTMYYCDADEIRALSLETGVSRLVKQHTCQWQTLLGLVNFDGLLLCRMTVDGQTQTSFISTADGRTLGTDADLLSFQDSGEAYFLQRQDGIVTEYLHGGYNTEPRAFSLDDSDRIFQYIPGMHSVLSVADSGKGRSLEAYDLEDGKLFARLELDGVQSVTAATLWDGCIWFVAGQGKQEFLCRWDPSATAQAGEQSYVTVRYTAAAPDLEGLARCQEKADALNERFGVHIVVMPEDVVQPGDYTLVTEHQVEAIEVGLKNLETALARFPEGFFRRIVEDTAGGVLHISLVRGISSNQAGLQYWVEADAYIALVAGESVERTVYHELCHVLDAFIYANSRDLDVWNSLNPEGFAYDYSYQLYTGYGTEYLEGENRAFVDAYSRTYPKEDRARILEYAMMPGNEAVFASETMQKKLHLLCFSLRDAFDWKRDERAFPWEQYLNEPLAYSKKK